MKLKVLLEKSGLYAASGADGIPRGPQAAAYETPFGGIPQDTEITALVSDTRRLVRGCLFFCIKGKRFDTHTKIAEIAETAAAVVTEADIADNCKAYVIRVASTREALSKIARVWNGYPGKDGWLVGVTGTNGKTSTTYFIESLLTAAGRKTGVIGTIGVRVADNDLGIKFTTSTTPDTVELINIFNAFRREGAGDAVMEVSSHALDQKRIDFLDFKVGVFTNLTQDHLDYHGNMEQYFAAKTRLFEFCEYAVINMDDEYGRRLAETVDCKVLTYGIEAECDFKAVNIAYSPNGVSYDLKYLESFARAVIPVAGKFNVYNSLAAIAVGFALNIPMKTIMDGMANVKNIPGRIQSIENDRRINVIVDYAHTPDGLNEIIKTVRKFSKRVITVFGCGGDRDRTKRPLMGEIAGKLSDYCILTSDNPRSEDPEDIIREIEEGVLRTNCKYEKITDRRQAIGKAIEMATEGESVIVAGKGHENYQELKNETVHFDDAAVCREFLSDNGGYI